MVVTVTAEEKKLRSRSQRLLKVYGITHAIYLEILASQGGVCAVCKQPPKPGKNLNVDHLHLKGKRGAGPIRGLLCFLCNKRRIGRETNPEIFQACADYLRKPFTGYVAPSKPKKKRRRKRARSGVSR